MRHGRRATLAVILLLLASCCVSAQITGHIAGTVLDSSGAAVSQARVSLTSQETGEKRQQIADGEGRFAFNQLKIGLYEVLAEASGFRQAVTESGVRSGEIVRVVFRLEVGQVTEAITVTDAVSPLDSVNSQIQHSLDTREVQVLPVPSRNPILLALTAPGIIPVPRAHPTLNSGNYNANGGRGRGNNITIDNITATDIDTTGNGGGQMEALNFEAIKEAKLITNNFSAEYGRNASSQLQFITKSGTNEFHGVAYEFLRNDKLNARSFFDTTGKASITRRNQFGYVLGGPIIRNKTHFFQSYEGLQLRGEGATRIAQVPTPAMVARIADPTSKKLFDQYQVPVSESGLIEQSTPNLTRAYQLSFRVDHQFSDRDSINARYAHAQSEVTSSGAVFIGTNIANFGANSVNGPRYLSLAETHLFSSTIVNEFRFGYGRGSPNFLINSTVPLGPRIEFANGEVNRFGVWEGYPQGRVQNTFQYSDTLTWVRGAHNLKFGADVYRYQANSVFDVLTRSLLRFDTWDDFAAGRPVAYQQRFGGSVRGFRETNQFYFAQDDWRVTRTLTLNLGIRSEVAGGISEVNGIASNLDIGCREPVGAAGTGPFGCFTLGKPAYDTNVNWSPRVGFAWNPGGDAKTVIRGGYGIAYDFVYFNLITNQRFLPPYIITQSISSQGAFAGGNTYANLVAGTATIQAEGIASVGVINPTARNLGSISPAIDTHLRNPQVHQWSFGVQRELFNDLVLKASYVGTKSNYLQRTRALNLIQDARMVPATSLADEDARLDSYKVAVAAASGNASRPSNRIDPRFNEINFVESSANSNYHAFEFEALKSFRQGYSFRVAYTAAKSIDDVSDALAAILNDSPAQQNPNDNRDNRAVSGFDSPQRLAITHIYELPLGRGAHNKVTRALLSGWSFAGITSFRSGFPITFDTGARRGVQPLTLLGTTGGVVRPDAAGSFDFQPEPARSAGAPNGLNNDPRQPLSVYAASLGLSQPLMGHFGTLGRNRHRLNGETNFDWNIYKNTALTERVNLQLRVELYNVFNNTSFQEAVRNISNPAFGQYTVVSQDGRVIQVGARIVF